MSRRAREIETLLLAMVAAAPLYLTGAVGMVPLIIFHVLLAGIAIRVAVGKGPELVPAAVMKAIAVLYVPLYIVDAAVISRSAIAASTHLVLFIAVYQPIESLRTNNQRQRMLTTALIFIASLATSTHISIAMFVVAFAGPTTRSMAQQSAARSSRSFFRSMSAGCAFVAWTTTKRSVLMRGPVMNNK